MTEAVTEHVFDSPKEAPRRFGWGLAGALLAHALLALFLLHRFGDTEIAPAPIPVDLVTLAGETRAPEPSTPAGPTREAALQQKQRPPARREQANPNRPARIAPSKNAAPLNDVQTPPTDALQTKLEQLAKLTLPESNSRILDGLDSAGRGRAGPGRGAGAYSVKDFIRQQVERRWSLNLELLGDRKLVVLIHLSLKRDGSVAKVEIVDTSSFGGDAVYRSVAISARNAVILSSPFALPEGSYDLVKDMVLDLNPRDTIR